MAASRPDAASGARSASRPSTSIPLTSFIPAAASFFKTLDNDCGTAWRTAFTVGLAVAFLLFLVRALYPVAGGIALTLAALYVRHTGRETEAVDGMIVGSVIGATAALPFVMT